MYMACIAMAYIEVLLSKRRTGPRRFATATQPQCQFESFLLPARVAFLHDHTITCCILQQKWLHSNLICGCSSRPPLLKTFFLTTGLLVMSYIAMACIVMACIVMVYVYGRYSYGPCSYGPLFEDSRLRSQRWLWTRGTEQCRQLLRPHERRVAAERRL